jgi:O-antigen/teichoic acid export membrane protein
MSIKVEVLSALRWSAAGRLAGQIGSWVATICIIRILSPADYGLMGMASILIGLAALFNELGVIPALIQSRHLNEQVIRQLFGFVIASTIFIFCVLFLAAPLMSTFFNEPRLTPITRALAVAMAIGAVSAVPNALLERDLRFRGLSVVEFLTLALGSVTTLGLAIVGYGVWSLVIGNIVTTAAKTIGVLVVSRFCLMPVFRLHGLRSMFVFGANITGQRVLWYVNSSADVLLVGKLLGDQALGVYSVAFQLATLPVSKMFGIVNRVAFPAYARLQDDNRQARDYFITSVKLSWLLFCPVLWGMSSISHEFVQVFMGGNWDDAGIVLGLIPLVVPFRVISLLLAPLTDGLGRPDIGLRNLATFTLMIPIAILIGTSWGLTGVCTGLIVASALALLINLRRSLALLELDLATLFGAIFPTLVAGLAMYLAVWLIKTLVFTDTAILLRLCAEIITGMVVYLAVTFLINRGAVRQCLSLVRMQA